MKFKSIINLSAILLSVFILQSCSSDNSLSEPNNNPLHFFTDMEQYVGFTEGAHVTRVTYAHSGKFVCKQDTISQYGYDFKSLISAISNKKLVAVKVSAYVYTETLPAKATMVCSIDNSDFKPIYYQSFNTSDAVTEKLKWIKVENTFMLPDTIKGDQRILIYLWNPFKEPIYVDDFSIDFQERQ